MTATAHSQERQQRALMSALLDGCCFDADIGFERFERKLTAKDLGLDEKDIPDLFRLGKKLLIGKKFLAIFQSLEARARREIDFYSLNFPIKGVRFVPMRCLPHLVETLDKLKSEFHERSEEFLVRYNELKQEMLTQYTRHRSAIEALYPPHEAVRQSFHFSYSMFQIALPAKLHKKAVDLRMTAEAQERANSIIAQKSAQMVEEFDTWANSIVENARQAVVTLFTTVRDKVRGGEAIHAKTVESLRVFIDQFRLLNILGDTKVEEALTEAKSYLDTGGINSKFAKEAFGEAVDAVLKAASNTTDVSQVTGGYRRKMME